jgi:hypothetical protein
MDRRLYVYYRVPEATLLATVATVRAMQATLVAAHPGLQTDLLRRPGLTDGAVTLMETYAGGDAASWSAALQRAAAALPGPRHDEWFEPLG